MSIKIIFEINPAGNYWLDYDSEDSEIVNHILCHQNWTPTKVGALMFCNLARVHGIDVRMPSVGEIS